MAGTGSIINGDWAPSAFALFMIQVIFILVLSKALAQILKSLKQPAVVAEMLAGIVLGPTIMGRIPNFKDLFFPAESVKIIQVISNFALIFFMFIVGLELDPQKLKADLKLSMFISFFGVLIPFGASCLLSLAFIDPEYSSTSFMTLSLFLTCGLGMSALPVLARILSERKMLATRLGGLAMTVAAVDDIVAYALLALTVAVVRSTSQIGVLYTILLTIGELLFMFFIVGPVIRWLVRRDSGHSHLNADTFLLLALILIGCSYIAEVIGLSALIGAFQVGLLIPRTSNLSHHISEKLEYVTVSILMPLYFTNSGLRTQFGLINDGLAVGNCILVIVVATLSKIIGIMAPAMYSGVPMRISGIIGILMSCKGLVALIVVNFGLDYNIITEKFFAILVMMVLVTTIMTVPLMQCLDPPSRARRTAEEALAWEEKMAKAAAQKAAKKAKAKKEEESPTSEEGVMIQMPEKLPGSRADTQDGNASVSTEMTESAMPRSTRRSRTSTVLADNVPEDVVKEVLHAVEGSDTIATITIPRLSSQQAVHAPSEDTSADRPGLMQGLTRRLSMRWRADSTSAPHRAGVPGEGLPDHTVVPTQQQQVARPSSAGAAGGEQASLLHVMLAIGETSAAPSLVSLLNILPSRASLLSGLESAVVTVAWLLDSMDMPSSYMNITETVDDIRDVTLASALQRCRLKDTMEIVTYPTEHPLDDTFEEASRRNVNLVLCSDLFVRGHADMRDHSHIDILSVALRHPKSCAMGLYVDLGPIFPVTKVLCVVDMNQRCVNALLHFVSLVDPSIEITFLHTGDADSERLQAAVGSDDRVTGVADGLPSVAEDSTSNFAKMSKRRMPTTSKLAPVVEMPTVGTFSAMLTNASDADIEAYHAAVEAARRQRDGEGTETPVPTRNLSTDSQRRAASTTSSTFTESHAQPAAAPPVLKLATLQSVHRPHVRELILSGGAGLAEGITHIFTTAPHAYDCIAVGLDCMDFYLPSNTAEEACDSAIAYVNPLLSACAEVRKPLLVMMPPQQPMQAFH